MTADRFGTLNNRRELVRTVQAFETLEGPGLLVRRAVPGDGLAAVGPFILLDHFGPEPMPPGKTFPPNAHPHAGIETVTYLLDGSFEHRDSAGGAGAVEAGEAQWMRAGRGVIHDEGPGASIRERGGTMQAVQLWINLPRGRKHVAPDYRAIHRRDIPELRVGDATLRLLAGEIQGTRGPITTFASPFAAHVQFAGPGRTTIAVSPEIELGVYLLRGTALVGGSRLDVHQLGILGSGNELEVAVERMADVLLLGGPALDAPLVRWGPFVMNSAAEIKGAISNFQSGRMGSLEEVPHPEPMS
jgi:redox-sensitive bicupin YhaK (pirin superfamily)